MTRRAQTGQLLLIAASIMLFAAFSSAMVVRRGLGGDWQPPSLPGWLWLTIPLALAASALVATGRTRSAAIAGAAIVVFQLGVLQSLSTAEISTAFASVLVSAHAAHAALGVAGLLKFGSKAALFWHFVGALWLYVLLLVAGSA